MSMNNNAKSGFTLIELLVVIAIIAILVSILIPVVARSKTKSKIAVARIQMRELETAIVSYKNDHGRFPVPKDYPRNYAGDVSFIDTDRWNDEMNLGLGSPVCRDSKPGSFYQGRSFDSNTRLNNSDLMVILMSEETPPSPVNNPYWWQYPRSSPQGANVKNSRNPKKKSYINPDKSKDIDDKVASPGLSVNGVYRDPFGNHFNVSMDVNGDGFCADGVYSTPYSGADNWAVNPWNATRLGLGHALVYVETEGGKGSKDSRALYQGKKWKKSGSHWFTLDKGLPQSPVNALRNFEHAVSLADFLNPQLPTPSSSFLTRARSGRDPVSFFVRKSEVMIWTAGPDGMASSTCPVFGVGENGSDVGADRDYDEDGGIDSDDLVNDDNILNWE